MKTPARPQDTPPVFVIRQHFLLDRCYWQKQCEKDHEAAEKLEVVSTVCDLVILRRRHPDLIKPSAAREPDLDEQAVALGQFDEEVRHCLRALTALESRKAHWLVHSVLRHGLAGLAAEARGGDGKALCAIAYIAVETCEALSQITRANPAALRPVARKTIRWPLMRSKNPRCCDSDEILSQIGLGIDCPVVADLYSKWAPSFPTSVASDLLSFLVQECRTDREAIRKNPERAWQAAKAAFLRTYPKPETIPDFDEMVTTAKGRKSDGRRRERIMTTIKRRFLSLLSACAS